MGSVIEKKIINEWRTIKDNGEKRKFYSDNILPVIIEVFSEGIETGKKERKIIAYSTLIIILSNDENTAKILSTSLKVKTVIVFYTKEKENRFKKNFHPYLLKYFSETSIKPILLDRINHQNNIKIINETIKNVSLEKGRTLCDITGGKKIHSVLLGIAAREFKIDICYFDSENLSDNFMPHLGKEVLYIHRADTGSVTKIDSAIYSLLKIGYRKFDDSNEITYDIITNDESSNLGTIRFSEDDARVLSEKITENNSIINGIISDGNSNARRELVSISRIIKSILMSPPLIHRIREDNFNRFKIILDEEISGIPWEIPLSMELKVELPIIRIPNKVYGLNEICGYEENEPVGILLIEGSSEGITDFKSYIDSAFEICSRFENFFSIKAENASELKMYLTDRNCFKVIIYYGHAEYSNEKMTTGWKCIDGSFFGPDSFNVMSGRRSGIIIANACESARSAPFLKNSFPFATLLNGFSTFIGTNWLLEVERSSIFINTMLENLIKMESKPSDCFNIAMKTLAEKYGAADLSKYNIVYYGK